MNVLDGKVLNDIFRTLWNINNKLPYKVFEELDGLELSKIYKALPKDSNWKKFVLNAMKKWASTRHPEVVSMMLEEFISCAEAANVLQKI